MTHGDNGIVTTLGEKKTQVLEASMTHRRGACVSVSLRSIIHVARTNVNQKRNQRVGINYEIFRIHTHSHTRLVSFHTHMPPFISCTRLVSFDKHIHIHTPTRRIHTSLFLFHTQMPFFISCTRLFSSDIHTHIDIHKPTPGIFSPQSCSHASPNLIPGVYTHLMNRPRTQQEMLRSCGVSAFCCWIKKSKRAGRCGPRPSRQPSDAAPSESMALSRCHTSVLASRSCFLLFYLFFLRFCFESKQ